MRQYLQNFVPHGNKIYSLWAALDSISVKTVYVRLTECVNIVIFWVFVINVFIDIRGRAT